MRVTLIKDDNLVGVDREFREVDLSGLDEKIHAVQWNNGMGEIEYNGKAANEKFEDFSEYQQYVDAWTAAALPPPSIEELRTFKVFTDFFPEALVRISTIVPGWDDLVLLKLVDSLWDTHLVVNATPAQSKARDIYLYVRDTVPARLALIPNETALEAINAKAAEPFGQGFPWPT